MRRTADHSRAAPAAHASPDVIPASGAYRTIIVLLAAWTVFAGLALATQGVPALSLGGDNASERMIGAYMLMVVPIYALIIWKPEEQRFLRWIPYAAQLAIILPFFWDTLITGDHGFADGAMLFVVSSVFLGVLVYVRSSSHPLGWFAEAFDDDDEEPADDEMLEEDDELLDEEEEEPAPTQQSGRGRRYRKSN